MVIGGSNLFPNYLKAKSPDGLRRLMFATNSKYKAWFKYDIQFAQGFWFAWYVADLSQFTQDDSLFTDQAQTTPGVTTTGVS